MLQVLAHSSRALSLLLLTAGLTACNEAEPKGKKQGPGEGAGETDSPDGEGEDPSADGSEGSKSLEAVLAECGGGEAADAGPDDVIYEKTLKSLPIVKTILIIKVTVDSTLAIKVTGSKTTQDATVTVSGVDTPLLADQVKAIADKQAAETSGPTAFTNVPIADYGNLSEHKAYDGIVCTVVPATKVDNRRGGKRTVAEFDPPVPQSLSPRAVGARYAAELGDKKVIGDIAAKIIETDSPDLTAGATIKGKVTFERVAAETQVDDGAGGKTTVKGDLAYKVTYDFGSPKATFALGFAPAVTYYIDHGKRDLSANVVDTAAVSGGQAVFLHP